MRHLARPLGGRPVRGDALAGRTSSWPELAGEIAFATLENLCAAVGAYVARDSVHRRLDAHDLHTPLEVRARNALAVAAGRCGVPENQL